MSDTPPKRRTPASLAALRHSPTAIFGIAVVLILLISAGVSLFWTPYDPVKTDPYSQFLTPSFEHLLGTDNSGRDIFSRLLVGARTTVVVALFSAIVSAVIGIALALLGALAARWIREPIAVIVDVLIAFPTILLAMMLASTFGGSTLVVIAAVGISYGVSIGRVARSEIRRVAKADYVLAARASGVGPWRNLTRHLLPNIAPVFIVQLSLSAALATLAEAALSYLGYGAPPGTPSWGRMLAELQKYITVEPLSVLWPGLAITLVVLGLNLLGDGLRDITDPRLARNSVPGSPVSDAVVRESKVQSL